MHSHFEYKKCHMTWARNRVFFVVVVVDVFVVAFVIVLWPDSRVGCDHLEYHSDNNEKSNLDFFSRQCYSGYPKTCTVDQAGHKSTEICLPLPPKCRN